MKLIPYWLQKKETSLLVVYRLTLFLSDGGKSLWNIGSETNMKTIQQEYLVENGFYCKALHEIKDCIFAEIDTTKTNLSSFYTWEEIQDVHEKKREDCFRTFVFCFEQPQDKIWFHSEICHQTFDGSSETPYALFQGLKNAYYT